MNIRQLAKLAGVPPATVSLALNGRPGVREDTRRRIWQMARQYGYAPTLHWTAQWSGRDRRSCAPCLSVQTLRCC